LTVPTLEQAPIPYDFLPSVPEFRIMSNHLADGHVLPELCRHGEIGGRNLSPDLEWSGYPDEARSFAVTCFDPDAPTGSGWWHWLVLDIPHHVAQLEVGAGSDDAALPAGARHARNDFGLYSYGGAAPPPGPPHRYVFTVHALRCERLDVPREASPALVGFHLTAQAAGRAMIVPLLGSDSR
jgi:Raf kinase inhibitor-like YbhB/YbcL family protein